MSGEVKGTEQGRNAVDFIRRNTHSVKWDLAAANVLPMWLADMDFPVAPEIVSAVEERLRHPYLGYGLEPESLFEAFIAWVSAAQGWAAQREWLSLAPSVMFGVRLAIKQFSKPGEGVIVPSPVYYPFFSSIEDMGRRLVDLPLLHSRKEERFVPDFSRLDELASEQENKILLLCSPHNPLGRVWEEEELEQLVDICIRHEVFIIADEIHADIVHSGHRFVPLIPLLRKKGREDLGLVLQGPGKTFNIPGISSATIVAPAFEVGQRMKKAIQLAGMEIPNVLALCAAEAAYARGRDWFLEISAILQGNIGLIDSFVDEYLRRFDSENQSYTPEGTYLYWLDLRKVVRDKGLSDKGSLASLKQEGGLWLSPGYLFSPQKSMQRSTQSAQKNAQKGAQADSPGSKGFFRLNFACPRELLVEGLSRLRAWCS